MAYIGYGYYKDDKGVYQLINGKKLYLDKNLNTDDSELITTRGGTPIYKDTNGEEIKFNDGNTFIQIQPTNQELTIN